MNFVRIAERKRGKERRIVMDIDNEFYFLKDELTKRWYEIAPFSIIDVELDISHRSITF